jgi:hypothetical protein
MEARAMLAESEEVGTADERTEWFEVLTVAVGRPCDIVKSEFISVVLVPLWPRDEVWRG